MTSASTAGPGNSRELGLTPEAIGLPNRELRIRRSVYNAWPTWKRYQLHDQQLRRADLGHPGPQRPPEALQVRWKAGTAVFARSFGTRGLADSFRSQLIQATRRGEAFDTITGLPE